MNAIIAVCSEGADNVAVPYPPASFSGDTAPSYGGGAVTKPNQNAVIIILIYITNSVMLLGHMSTFHSSRVTTHYAINFTSKQN